jgi:hypothetical protein
MEAALPIKRCFAGNRVGYPLVIRNFADSKPFPFFFFHDGEYLNPTDPTGGMGGVSCLPADERPLQLA